MYFENVTEARQGAEESAGIARARQSPPPRQLVHTLPGAMLSAAGRRAHMEFFPSFKSRNRGAAGSNSRPLLYAFGGACGLSAMVYKSGKRFIF